MSRKLSAGSSLAQYKIVGLIGEGGMGAVYEALDESLDRHVAIKTLLSEVAQDPESRKRFFLRGQGRREASDTRTSSRCTASASRTRSPTS